MRFGVVGGGFAYRFQVQGLYNTSRGLMKLAGVLYKAILVKY